jgi:hypothetical protein
MRGLAFPDCAGIALAENMVEADIPGSASRASLPFPGAGFVVGAGEDFFLGEGWWERVTRRPQPVPFRPTDKEATFYLRAGPGHGHLKILFLPPVFFLGHPYRGEILMDDTRLGALFSDAQLWLVRRFDLPRVEEPRVARFSIRNETVAIPAKCIAGSHDFRPMGCYLAAAMLCPGPAEEKRDSMFETLFRP